MNKNIKRIIALTLTINAFSTISAMTPGVALNFITKPVYASSYSPSSEELKSLTLKSTNGDTLDLLDDYYGDTVKLNDDKEYYVRLTDDSEGIKINATVKDSDYIVRIFTSDKNDAIEIKPDEKIPLAKGNTTIYVRTYESLSEFRKAKEDKKDVRICEEEYTINMKKTTASSYEDTTQDSIYLGEIDINKGDITFLKQRTSYDIKVDSGVSEIKITAKPQYSGDRVRIDGLLVDSSKNYRKTVSLDKGKNEIKIKVTDDKDNQRTYTLNVTRGSSSNNDQDEIYLRDISLSDGKINFSEEDTTYKIDLDASISKITITAEPEDDEYLVTVNDEELSSGDDYEKEISLSKGKNTVKVKVEDEVNDKKRTYTLTINRGTAEDITTTTDTSTKKEGWVQTEAGWIYYDATGKQLKNSWLFDKEQGVYCYLNENGIRKTGWFKDNDKWYLLGANGAMLKGWQDANGKRYFLDVSGAMKTGWYLEEVSETQSNTNTSSDTSGSINTEKTKNWYYLNSDGSMKAGWLLYGGKWYYLNTNGIMQKGWLISSNSKYYLNADGTMATGTKTIDGKVYKFTAGGALII